MSQYLIRKGKLSYELAKFEDSDGPVAVYSISKRGCNCPASRRSCKHTTILTAWQKLKEPFGAVFDDEANLLGVLAVC